MRHKDLIETFNDLCAEVGAAEDSYSENVELLYERLLAFLIEHSEDRALLAAELVSIVRRFRFARTTGVVKLSVDAIAFCMHQLRWSEVLEVARLEHDTYFAERRDSTLLRLISAFDDEWEEAEDYSRFRNQ